MSDHSQAVAALRGQYSAIPTGAPVRLAKPTSNLFRFRADQPGGLDVARFDRVLSVDPAARTAEVQGMTTYERLVDATLPHGLMPLVVPQLKTITVGGAVAGLGIESSSFRNGLPHESVRELEVMTGDGEVVVVHPDDDLFRGFPNSYGTLGYALRLEIELEPVKPFVRLRHVPFGTAAECAEVIAAVCAERSYQGEPVDFIDGTVFSAHEQYLTLADWSDTAPHVSDYTGRDIYYRSIQARRTDYLTVRDYLWRWDTDWFWCSRAFGVQRPLVRRLVPKRYLRSDVYRKIVAWDRRRGFTAKLSKTVQESVMQDVEIPVSKLAEFMDFFHREIGIEPVWMCPLRLRDRKGWPLYPMDPEELYVNVGFWSIVDLAPGEEMGSRNRLIERTVAELGGHKSLYSDSYYEEEEFWANYNGPTYRDLKRRYDADSRLPDLYAKCVLRS
ncbi:FAD/FMN-containing dehydrogenase [Saccharothrix tamanrassetensis]|uniref:Delta(24)-sterol reductase n=1 Tax=Saccharothrix tamanrassetensis TaxID=1051531 RepID=A0A841CTU1_9PSEU|nr:FAD-binding oxidoreductase [Saccharothrix tamanrassetensis]MBB5960273.1 FAD/FMN-containing dehydrogenase [Saccharothrix tamanrassetensis]